MVGSSPDSPLEEDGFELAVPPRTESLCGATPGKHRRLGPEPVGGSAFSCRRLRSATPRREPSQERDRWFKSGSLQQRVGRTPRGSWLLHTSVRFGLTKNFTLTKRVDDAPVWSLSCFYVRKGYRRKGVAETVIGAALSAARCAKAPALEAYPLDAELTPSASSTGYASTFSRAGFKTV